MSDFYYKHFDGTDCRGVCPDGRFSSSGIIYISGKFQADDYNKRSRR